MKNILLLCILLFSMSIPAFPQKSKSIFAYVSKKEGSILRKEPFALSKSLQIISYLGILVIPFEESQKLNSSKWIKANYKNTIGFIQTKNIDIIYDLGNIPISNINGLYEGKYSNSFFPYIKLENERFFMKINICEGIGLIEGTYKISLPFIELSLSKYEYHIIEDTNEMSESEYIGNNEKMLLAPLSGNELVIIDANPLFLGCSPRLGDILSKQ